MSWKIFVKWGAHILGLLAACIGYAFREPVAIAIFGAYLVFEFWVIDVSVLGAAKEIENTSKNMGGIPGVVENIQKGLAELLYYEYLPEASLIWARANIVLNYAQPNDEIRSTASTPNNPEFEISIIKRIFQGDIVYKRLVCYAKPVGDPRAHQLPSVEAVKGSTAEEVLKAYIQWYPVFYSKLQAALTGGNPSGDIDNVGMSIWHEALLKIVPWTNRRFEVRPYGASLPSDYFILNPQDSRWKAVVGFPRLQGEGMRSGFSTSHSFLARDLGSNWQSLWEQAQKGL